MGYCIDIQLVEIPDYELIHLAKQYNAIDWTSRYIDEQKVLSIEFQTTESLFMYLRHLSECLKQEGDTRIIGAVTRFCLSDEY